MSRFLLRDKKNQQLELDLLLERVNEIIKQADTRNRQNIQAQSDKVTEEWTALVSDLENRRDALTGLAQVWENFEGRWQNFESLLTGIEERTKHLDFVVRSKDHVMTTKRNIEELQSEAEALKPHQQEVIKLSNTVLMFLRECSSASATALSEKLAQLNESYERLLDSLREKHFKTAKDLQEIEAALNDITKRRGYLYNLKDDVVAFYVFDANLARTERDYKNLQERVSSEIKEVKDFSSDLRNKYNTSQQLVPSDIAHELNQLELLAEAIISAMDDKDRQFKKARTVRTDYVNDVDDVQSWLKDAELKVQDRSAEPHILNDHLQQVQSEIASISDRIEKLTKNGRTIIEKTKDDEEKAMVQSTIDNIVDQFAQVKSWLEERRQQVGETLDAWQRFISLYQAVMQWVHEKKIFLQEPLFLSTLQDAKQRLHDYNNAVKSCKGATKNLSDMAKELEYIGSVTSVGDLPQKMEEAEEAKTEVEAIILERNALLQETSEEWEQCEKKIKEVRSWIDKNKSALESQQNKKKPLRDQHGLREKMLADIQIQKTKISLSVEKLQLHFRSGVQSDSKVTQSAEELVQELDELDRVVRDQITQLETAIAQVDQYQLEVQQLRQQIVQVEQQLRAAMAPTYLPHDREQAVREQQDLSEDVERLQQLLNSTETSIEYLPREGYDDMLRALENITSELKKHAAEAIRLEGQVNLLTSDHDTQSLAAHLAGIRTRIATLLSQAENGRILVTNARQVQIKKQEELTKYQILLTEIEIWLDTTKLTIEKFVKPKEEKQVESSIQDFENLEKELAEKKEKLNKLASVCEEFKKYPDLQELVEKLLEQLRILTILFEEQNTIIITQIISLKQYLVEVKEGKLKPESPYTSLENTLDSTSMPIEELQVHADVKNITEDFLAKETVAQRPVATIETQTGRSLTSPVEEPTTKDFTVTYHQPVDAQIQTQMSQQSTESEPTPKKETIRISKRTTGGQETIQIATKPVQAESQPIVEEPEDLLVEADYRKRPESESRTTELNITNIGANQPFETVFVEPDETTTEVIVDADGTKRIIVKRLHRTVVRHQESTQQQQLTTLSTLTEGDIPVNQTFSQISLKGQQTATTVAKGDGSKAILTSQQYGGKVVSGLPGGEIDIQTYQTEPETHYTVFGPTLKPEEVEVQGIKLHEGDVTFVDNQSNQLIPADQSRMVVEGNEIHTSSSSVRAVVQQVTRRIIRKTRRIIRRIVIIDGKEHVTEEVVEEPEEVEVTEEGIPRVSINVTRTEDGKIVQQQQFGEEPTILEQPGVSVTHKTTTIILDAEGKPVEKLPEHVTLVTQQPEQRYVVEQQDEHKALMPEPAHSSTEQLTQVEISPPAKSIITEFIESERLSSPIDSSGVDKAPSFDAAPKGKSKKKKKSKKTPDESKKKSIPKEDISIIPSDSCPPIDVDTTDHIQAEVSTTKVVDEVLPKTDQTLTIVTHILESKEKPSDIVTEQLSATETTVASQTITEEPQLVVQPIITETVTTQTSSETAQVPTQTVVTETVTTQTSTELLEPVSESKTVITEPVLEIQQVVETVSVKPDVELKTTTVITTQPEEVKDIKENIPETLLADATVVPTELKETEIIEQPIPESTGTIVDHTSMFLEMEKVTAAEPEITKTVTISEIIEEKPKISPTSVVVTPEVPIEIMPQVSETQEVEVTTDQTITEPEIPLQVEQVEEENVLPEIIKTETITTQTSIDVLKGSPEVQITATIPKPLETESITTQTSVDIEKSPELTKLDEFNVQTLPEIVTKIIETEITKLPSETEVIVTYSPEIVEKVETQTVTELVTKESPDLHVSDSHEVSELPKAVTEEITETITSVISPVEQPITPIVLEEIKEPQDVQTVITENVTTQTSIEIPQETKVIETETVTTQTSTDRPEEKPVPSAPPYEPLQNGDLKAVIHDFINTEKFHEPIVPLEPSDDSTLKKKGKLTKSKVITETPVISPIEPEDLDKILNVSKPDIEKSDIVVSKAELTEPELEITEIAIVPEEKTLITITTEQSLQPESDTKQIVSTQFTTVQLEPSKEPKDIIKEIKDIQQGEVVRIQQIEEITSLTKEPTGNIEMFLTLEETKPIISIETKDPTHKVGLHEFLEQERSVAEIQIPQQKSPVEEVKLEKDFPTLVSDIVKEIQESKFEITEIEKEVSTPTEKAEQVEIASPVQVVQEKITPLITDVVKDIVEEFVQEVVPIVTKTNELDQSVLIKPKEPTQAVDIVLSLEEKYQDSEIATPKVSIAMKVENEFDKADILQKDIHVQLPTITSEKIETNVVVSPIVSKLDEKGEELSTPSDLDHGGRKSKRKKKHKDSKTPTPVEIEEIEDKPESVISSLAESTEIEIPEDSVKSEETPKPTQEVFEPISESEEEADEDKGKETGYEADKTTVDESLADDDNQEHKKRRRKKRKQKVKVKDSDESNVPKSVYESSPYGESVPLTDDEPSKLEIMKPEDGKKKKRKRGKRKQSESEQELELESENTIFEAQDEEIQSANESYHTISTPSEPGTVKIVEENILTPQSESPQEITSKIVTTVPILEAVITQETVVQTSPEQDLTAEFIQQERVVTEKPVERISAQTSPAEIPVEQTSVQTSPEVPKETAELSIQTIEEPAPKLEVEVTKPEIQESSTQIEIETADIITQTTPKASSPEEKVVTETTEVSMQTISPVKAELIEEAIQTVTPEPVELPRSESAIQTVIESHEEYAQTKSPETVVTTEIATQVQPDISEFALQTSPEPSAPPLEPVEIIPERPKVETTETIIQTSPVVIQEIGEMITPSPTPTPSSSEQYEIHVQASVLLPSDLSGSITPIEQTIEKTIEESHPLSISSPSTLHEGEDVLESDGSDDWYDVQVDIQGIPANQHTAVTTFLEAEKDEDHPHKRKRKRHRKHKKQPIEEGPNIEKDLFTEFQRQSTVDESLGPKDLYADVARRSRSPSPVKIVKEALPQEITEEFIEKIIPEDVIHQPFYSEEQKSKLPLVSEVKEAEVTSKIFTDLDEDKVRKLAEQKSIKPEQDIGVTVSVTLTEGTPASSPDIEIITKDTVTISKQEAPPSAFTVDSTLTEAKFTEPSQFEHIEPQTVQQQTISVEKDMFVGPKSVISSTTDFILGERVPELDSATVFINDQPLTLKATDDNLSTRQEITIEKPDEDEISKASIVVTETITSRPEIPISIEKEVLNESVPVVTETTKVSQPDIQQITTGKEIPTESVTIVTETTKISQPETKETILQQSHMQKSSPIELQLYTVTQPEDQKSKPVPSKSKGKGKHVSSVTIEEIEPSTILADTPLTPASDAGPLSPPDYSSAVWHEPSKQDITQSFIESEAQQGPLLLKEVNVRWNQAQALERFKNLQNARKTTHLSDVLYLATLHEIITDETVEQRNDHVQQNLLKLQNAVERRDATVIQQSIITTVETITTWLETIEYRIYVNRQQTSEGPSKERVQEFNDLKQEIANIESKVEQLQSVMKDTDNIYNEDDRERMKSYIDSLQQQVKVIEEVTEENEQLAVDDLKRWEEFIRGVDDVNNSVRELRRQLSDLKDSDASPQTKLNEMERLENSNRVQMVKAMNLTAAAKGLMRDFPGREIPRDVYLNNELTKQLEQQINVEREKALQFLSLADEYEQTLKEFSQIILIAEALIESPITVRNLEHLEDEMQNHRKFFVNLSHCRAILESLEENLDSETRTIHSELHQNLYERARVILDKSTGRFQIMSLAASRWTVLEQGTRDEMRWLQVAQQRIPDLNNVTSSDYERYIDLYQSLAADIDYHHAKLTHLNNVAQKLLESVHCSDLEQAFTESLEIIQKLQEDVQNNLERLVAFREIWTVYNMLSDKIEYWLKDAEVELKKIEVPTGSRTHLRQFWELKAQHEVHNATKQNVANSLEKALQIVPISDEMVQRKFNSELNIQWQKVSKRISDIETAILDTLSAPDVPVNEKLILLEQELQDLKLDIDNLKGIIKTEEDLNLYVERLQIMSTRLETIQNELGKLGLLSAGESDKVGILLALSKRLEVTIGEELEGGILLKDRLQAIQKGLTRVRRKHSEMSKKLDQCEGTEKLGSEAVEKAVNDCYEVGEELVTLWQDLMSLRQLLHTLPMRLKVTVSPVKVERDISQLQDDHTKLEKRCGQILALLRSRLTLWQRFERQLEMLQQSVQEADFMVELLTVQGTVDYERLRKATERLEGLSCDLSSRDHLIAELKTTARPLADSCSPEISAKVEAAVEEAVAAYESTCSNLKELCDKYQHAAELWKQYKEASDLVKEWLERPMEEVDSLEGEEVIEKVKVCDETLDEHRKRLANLQELVSGIASAVGLDAKALLGGEVEALSKRLDDVKVSLTQIADVAEKMVKAKQEAKEEINGQRIFLDSVQKSIGDLERTGNEADNEHKLTALRDHLLALSVAQGKIQQIKDKTIEVSTTRTETSVIEILELWQQVFKETFQQYHRLSTRLVKNEDGAAALKLWQEYLLNVQQFLQGTIPGDYHSLSEHQHLCQVHQNLLTTQQNVLKPKDKKDGQLASGLVESSVMEQFSQLTNLHNETLSRIMDRHVEVQKRLDAWEQYKEDQKKLLTWLKNIEKEREHMQLRYMHIRRIPKLRTRIQNLLDKIPQGEDQAQDLQRQQNLLLQFCDDALATSIRMEHAAIKQRIVNLHAGLETWKLFLDRITDLIDTHENRITKVQKLFDGIQETINDSVTQTPTSHTGISNTLDILQSAREQLNGSTRDLEQLGLSQEQLKECLSPSDLKTVNQRMWLLWHQQSDLDHQLATLCHQLEDKLGVRSMFETRHARFIGWADELERRLNLNFESTSTPIDPKELLRKLETELQAEMALKEREYNWLLRTGQELVESCGEEYADVTAKQIIQARTDEVFVRWERLENIGKMRFNKINDIMQTMLKLEERIAQIRAWLSQIESELSRPIIFENSSKTTIDKKLQDHDKLKKSIENESGNIGDVLNLCELLMTDTDVVKAHFSTEDLALAVQNLEKRWKIVCGQSAEMKRKITFIWKLLQEVLKLSTDQEQWLAEKEDKLQELDRPLKKLDREQLQELIYEVESEIKDISSRIPAFQILEQTYSKLVTESGIEPENIQDLTARARTIIARWNNLLPRAEVILQKLHAELQPFKDFSVNHEDAVVGLTKIDAQLTQLQHLTPNEEMTSEEKLKKLQAIENELAGQTPTLETADKLGLEIMKKSKKQEIVKIQEMIDEYQILCKNIHERIIIIKTEIIKVIEEQRPQEVDESVQVETLKFEQDTAVQVNTLPPQLQRMTSISAKDAYLVELEAALAECKTNITELETFVNKEIPKQGSPELPIGSKKIAKMSAKCQASTELIKHLHDLLLDECDANKDEACSEEVRNLLEQFQLLLVLAKEKEIQLRELRTTVSDKYNLLCTHEAGRLLCPLCTKRNWAQLDNDLWRLEKWLQVAEGTQKAQKSPPSNIEQLEDIIQDHREFLLDLDSHKSIVRSLNIVGSHLADHSEDTSKADELRSRLESDNKRWEVICRNAAEWQLQLQRALMDNQQFHNIIAELCTWLEKNEKKIKASEPVDLTADRETIEMKYHNFLELRAELERCEPRVLSLQEAANQLLREDEAPEGSSLICRRLTELRLKLQSLIRLTVVYTLKLGAVLGRDPHEIGLAISSASTAPTPLHSFGYDLLDQPGRDGPSTSAPDDAAYNGSEKDEEINTSVLRRGYRFLGRVVRASVPIQAVMLLLLGAASLVPYSEDDYSCSLVNSIANSLTPTLRYNDGPPPI